MAVSREEIIEALKEMSLLEASELVKDIEETFGVSAAAPVAVAAAPAAGGSCPTARPRWAAWRHSAGPALCRPCDRCSCHNFRPHL